MRKKWGWGGRRTVFSRVGGETKEGWKKTLNFIKEGVKRGKETFRSQQTEDAERA